MRPSRRNCLLIFLYFYIQIIITLKIKKYTFLFIQPKTNVLPLCSVSADQEDVAAPLQVRPGETVLLLLNPGSLRGH